MAQLQTSKPDRTTQCAPKSGSVGAVAAAHPLAVQAGIAMLAAGGTAVDAAIAAQAIICVVMPNAAGLGGDMLALIHTAQGISAIGGTGLSPTRTPTGGFSLSGGASVTVPGLVDGWLRAHAGWGRLDLSAVLAPAVNLAAAGHPVEATLASAVASQRARLLVGGAADWSLLTCSIGSRWRQPELASLLTNIGRRGAAAFYEGPIAAAICAGIQGAGGSMLEQDLSRHRTLMSEPISVRWRGATVYVQPPPTQASCWRWCWLTWPPSIGGQMSPRITT